MQDNDQRKNLKKDTWIIVLALSAVLVFFFTNFGENNGRYYDCRDAHWHPDVPIEVKNECIKIMRDELKRKQEEESKKRYITT